MPALCRAQDQVTISKDTIINKELAIILSNDSIIKQGVMIKTGRGSLPNGNFKYIHTSASSWVAVMSATQNDPYAGVTPLGRRYGGLLMNVKSVKNEGNKKRGFKYILKVGGGNIVNYEVEIEDAISTGEIVEHSQQQPTPTLPTSSTTPADELKKLKDLYDSGAITKDEYDSAKKKILAKM
jgi:hypothetical protein